MYPELQIHVRLFFFFSFFTIQFLSHKNAIAPLTHGKLCGRPRDRSRRLKTEFVCETPSAIIYYLRLAGATAAPLHFRTGRGLSSRGVRLVIRARRFASLGRCDFIEPKPHDIIIYSTF